MMRAYTLRLLETLAGKGKKITDDDIVRWANETLSKAGKKTSISSFKDQSISTSHAVIDLVDVLKPNSINYGVITPGETDDVSGNICDVWNCPLCMRVLFFFFA